MVVSFSQSALKYFSMDNEISFFLNHIKKNLDTGKI